MEKITFISFYTPGYYEEILNKYLLPSLKKYNLNYIIYKKENLHDWSKNGRQKYEIIYSHLINFKENIVFLDADAEIIKYPELLFNLNEHDIAVHYLDWSLFWHNQPNQNKYELIASTIYIGNNTKTKKLFKQLYELTKGSYEWGQKILPRLLDKNKEINCYRLPLDYCRIIKTDEKFIPTTEVIIQHQASRAIRKREIQL